MNAQNTCNTYTLLQFNAPTHLKEKLNILSDYRRIPRNAIINEVLEKYIRDSFELIEKDGLFTDLVERVQEKVAKSLKRAKKPEPVPTIEKKKTPEKSWSWENSYV
jgi:predicted DNA-binding protein